MSTTTAQQHNLFIENSVNTNHMILNLKVSITVTNFSLSQLVLQKHRQTRLVRRSFLFTFCSDCSDKMLWRAGFKECLFMVKQVIQCFCCYVIPKPAVGVHLPSFYGMKCSLFLSLHAVVVKMQNLLDFQLAYLNVSCLDVLHCKGNVW